MEIYIVEVRDSKSEFRSIESVHLTAEGAEDARKHRQMIWGEGNPVNPRRYHVHVRTMVAND